MKRVNTAAIFFLMVFLFPGSSVVRGAETSGAAAETPEAAETAETGGEEEAGAVKEQLDEQKKSINILAKRYEKLKEIIDVEKGRVDNIEKTVKNMEDELKKLEEKSMELCGIAEKLGQYGKRLDRLRGDYEESEEETQKYIKEFTKMKDVLRERADKMQSWDDILDVLKSEISNNEREIARLKKDIGEVKRHYTGEDDMFSAVLQWPYAGITALAVSLAAFAVAVAK